LLTALSVDAAAKDALFGRPFRGRVHSVFAKAVNFTGPWGRLYCLAAEELDDAPATVRVRLPAGRALDNLGIQPGHAVVSAAGGLACGPVKVAAGSARPWTADLPVWPADVRPLAANLERFKAAIGAAGQSGGLKAYINGGASTALERLLTERAEALAAALAACDTGNAVAAGQRLVGLGPGLTPSGDDFLAGLMIILNMPHSPFGREYRRTAAKLAAGAATGAVSRAMLSHAARGRTRAGVVDLLVLLTGAAEDGIDAAARRVLDGGATSGTDFAAGLAAGLTVGLHLAGEKEE
jgi:hypothetical protein